MDIEIEIEIQTIARTRNLTPTLWPGGAPKGFHLQAWLQNPPPVGLPPEARALDAAPPGRIDVGVDAGAVRGVC